MAKQRERRGVLRELEHRPIEFSLDEELRSQILGGRRATRLQNADIPYQTPIRHLLSEGIKRELKVAG